jgi:hypothetical protein
MNAMALIHTVPTIFLMPPLDKLKQLHKGFQNGFNPISVPHFNPISVPHFNPISVPFRILTPSVPFRILTPSVPFRILTPSVPFRSASAF